MKVFFNQKSIKEEAKLTTYQSPFPETLRCKRCKNDAKLMLIINDETGLLIKERPESVRVWPHDYSSTAVYLCTNCGSMRAEWNQA